MKLTIGWLLSCCLLVACGGSNSNQIPVLEPQQLNVQFEQAFSFELPDRDQEGDKLEYQLQKAPQIGQLSQKTAYTYEYTPATGQTEMQEVLFNVTDGHHQLTHKLTLTMVDNRPLSVQQILPANNSQRVSVNTSIELSFNSVVSLPAITADKCKWLINLQVVGQPECVPLKANQNRQDRKKLSLQPELPLLPNQQYQLIISGELQSFSGQALTQQTAISFHTEHKDILLSEVNLYSGSNNTLWLELYNGTASDINLKDYVLISQSLNRQDFTEQQQHKFSLPDHLLKSGEHLVLKNRAYDFNWQNGWQNNPRQILLQDGEQEMYWQFDSGYLVLENQKKTEITDVLLFGQGQLPESYSQHWSQAAVTTDKTYLVRNVRHHGPKVQQWQGTNFPTAAAINDVLCEQDNDQDGLPDCNEQPDTTYAGLPLYSWGARPEQRDIFIEIDYMQSDDPGVTPQWQAVNKLVQTFALRGFRLHVDVGDLFANTEFEQKFDLGGGQQVPFSQTTHFKTAGKQSSILGYKSLYMHSARVNAFHYMLFANSQNLDGSAGSSGYAEITGDDSMISLGGWGLNQDNELGRNYLINIQASTMMHEFGHNLGLLHGGLDGQNYKPNHLSVMNYMYQLEGLPDIQQAEGDRLLNRLHFPNPKCVSFPLHHGPEQDYRSFRIDFSAGLSKTLDESALDEKQGFGLLDSSGIDYNCNGELDAIQVKMDLDLNGWDQDLLYDYDEWREVRLDFNRRAYMPPPVFSIEQQLKELAPPKTLLKAIQQAKDSHH